MTAAEINAYLEWRAEREGKTVDVSPEAYRKYCILGAIVTRIELEELAGGEHTAESGIQDLADMAREYRELEKEN